MTTVELFKDAAFVKEVAGIKSVEDVQKAFAAKGVNISIDELNTIKEKFITNGKLNEEDLENVAGGSSSVSIPIIFTDDHIILDSGNWDLPW